MQFSILRFCLSFGRAAAVSERLPFRSWISSCQVEVINFTTAVLLCAFAWLWCCAFAWLQCFVHYGSFPVIWLYSRPVQGMYLTAVVNSNWLGFCSNLNSFSNLSASKNKWRECVVERLHSETSSSFVLCSIVQFLDLIHVFRKPGKVHSRGGAGVRAPLSAWKHVLLAAWASCLIPAGVWMGPGLM